MMNYVVYLVMILVGMIIIGIVMVIARYLREIHLARIRVDSLGNQVIETAYGPVEYVRVGEGYPVLVIHGAFGGFDQGLWVASSYDVTNFQVLSVSRFGYLRTPLPSGANLSLQADAFAGLLDALGIQRVAVFGVSEGSTSAIRFAARYPERVSALILFGPDAPGQNYMTMPPRFFMDKVLRNDFIYWVLVSLFSKKVQNAIGLAPRGYVLTPDTKALIKKIQFGSLPISQRMDGEIFVSYTMLPEFFESVLATSPYPLSQVETPVLVINAADDPISLPQNVRSLAGKMPNARLFVLPDGGHFLFGHSEEVKAEIAQFLRNMIGEPQKSTAVEVQTNRKGG
jgi:pimeloyl-ACP methyl ester carboxylesterase